MDKPPNPLLELLFGATSSLRGPAPPGFPPGSFAIGPIVFSDEQPSKEALNGRRSLGDIMAMIAAGIADKADAPHSERPGAGVKGGTQRPTEHKSPPKAEGNMPFETKDNGILLKANNLRVVHISNPAKPNAGISIAWRSPAQYTGRKGAATMEVATALVHPTDTFSRKIGTARAVEAFLAGHTVLLPVIAGYDEARTLQFYFESAVGL